MSRSCCRLPVLLFALLLAAGFAFSQVAPSFRGGEANLWAGAQYSNFNSDFSAERISGAGVYVDFNRDRRWGAEAEARFLRFVPYDAGTEDTYMLGPRVMALHHARFFPYAKVLLGVGLINFPYSLGHGSYFIFAPGGGVDYRLARKLSLRGDYEHQFWPSAPGIPGLPSHGLQPGGFNIGISYRVFQAGGAWK